VGRSRAKQGADTHSRSSKMWVNDCEVTAVRDRQGEACSAKGSSETGSGTLVRWVDGACEVKDLR